jgi:hypothetical protein
MSKMCWSVGDDLTLLYIHLLRLLLSVHHIAQSFDVVTDAGVVCWNRYFSLMMITGRHQQNSFLQILTSGPTYTLAYSASIYEQI